jgi:hypothetical protein
MISAVMQVSGRRLLVPCRVFSQTGAPQNWRRGKDHVGKIQLR